MYFAADADLRVVKVCGSVGIEASELIQICKTATSGEPIYKGRNVIWVLDWWGKQLAVKAFGIPWGIRKWVYGSVRASKANRSYINASALIARGLRTPKPIGYAEFGSRFALHKSFYVSEYLPMSATAFPLRDVLLEAGIEDRDRILLALGRFTCKLHDLEVLHRDYSPGNILVTRSVSTGREFKASDGLPPSTGTISGASPGFEYDFELVDLNRMSFGQLSMAQRMQNLRLLWADDDDLRVVVTGYASAIGAPTDVLFQLAHSASWAHKNKATREERLKRTIRRWLAKVTSKRYSS